MSTDLIVPLRDTEAVSKVGGKAAALGNLLRCGVNVPDGFVVTPHISVTQSDEINAAIVSAFDRLHTPWVAVRSSGTGEDSDTASWAGQFDTYLNVGRNDIIEKIQACRDSARSERGQAYGQQKQAHNTHIAVLVQAMIQSDVSGVAFSVHPVTHNTEQIVIEAGLGLGEAVVSGEITPDTYVIQKVSGTVLEKHISPQHTQLRLGTTGTNTWQATGAAGSRQKLSDELLAELAVIVRRIEIQAGSPQDVEWAYANEKLYILQSRPITTL